MKITNDIPKITGERTQGYISDDSITYNQANITYNQSGITYGGFYGLSQVQPLFAKVAPIKIVSIAKKTLQNFYDQSITYNEPGLTYNQVDYAYGGFYGYNDVQPIFAKVAAPRPLIANYADIYTPGGTVPVGQNQSIGPGFFMFITR